jgi:hypothetical protein
VVSAAATMLTSLADASAASHAMQTFVAPVFATLAVLATLASTFFLVNGGIAYMTSTGRPDKLEHAKKVIRNALIGLVIVIAAGAMTAILTHAYHNAAAGTTNVIPQLTSVKPTPASAGLVDVLIKAITGLLQNIIQTAAQPFLDALSYFTKATPMMAANSSVFELWLAIVGIADAMFVLVVALLGFHVMSHATLGMEEIEIKHMLPQIGLAFLALNMSIFAIDAVISLSNAMIHALYAAFPVSSVWQSLADVTKQSASMGLVALLIMVAFLVFAVILLIYYVTRLVTLYLGAILSPLFVLLWLLPAFKDFAVAAAKTYLTTVFVLFVHVVILLLAASIFAGMVSGSPDKSLDPVMSSVVGLAALIALLKTQGVLNQLAYVSIGPKAMRRLGSQFINSVSYASTKMRTARAIR